MSIRNLCFSVAAISFGATAIQAGAAAPSKPALKSVPPKVATVDAATGKASVEAMLALMDKLFPPQPDPDPARLALARTSVASMWPDGSYGKMMSGLMGNMFTGVMQLQRADLGALARESKSAPPPADQQSFHDHMAARDPYFDVRMSAMRDVMDEEIGKVSQIIDPRMREGVARSMARRFDARQLADINSFFATPSGHALASQYMQLWADPDAIRAIFNSMPEMMRLAPEIMTKMKAVNAKFPPPPGSKPPAKP